MRPRGEATSSFTQSTDIEDLNSNMKRYVVFFRGVPIC